MRYIKWIGLAAAVLLIISCFTPWVVIVSKNITISGVDGSTSNFGKPGYFNLLMTGLFLFFHFVPRVWAKRTNFLVVALNIAWAFRNLLMLSFCSGGECPEKQAGLYLVVLASLMMLVAALFPDMKLPEKKNN
jgi:hypothetical protein